jgi:N-acetylglucosamine PTS system EIIB component
MGKAEDIIEALGGAANIQEIEACATRLRTVVADSAGVNQKALKSAGAFGVLSAGNVLQVIVGGEADGLAADINHIIG